MLSRCSITTVERAINAVDQFLSDAINTEINTSQSGLDELLLNLSITMSRSLNLALLGASGPTGQRFLEQALERGHHVTALVRNPSKIAQNHENLKVEVVDIFDSSSLAPLFSGSDAVVSCLGTRRGDTWRGKNFYGESMRVIIDAMRTANIKRLVPMTSWGTYRDRRSSVILDYGFRFIIAKVLDSMREMELYLEKECSDIDFTVVRPAGLTDGPITDKTFQVEPDCPCVPQGWCGGVFQISRADVARFMLIHSLEEDKYKKECVSILV